MGEFKKIIDALTDIPARSEWAAKPGFYSFLYIELTLIILTVIFLGLAIKQGLLKWKDEENR